MANKLFELFGIGKKPAPIENVSTKVIEEQRTYTQSVGSKNKRALNPDAYEYREPAMFGITLKDWMNAVDTAWSYTNPNRVDLCDIYKAMTSYDSQTIACINQRKLFTLQGDMAFYNEDGTINEEATKLIKSPSGSTQKWFKNFMSYSLDSIFWGYELLMIDVKNNVIEIKKVPERNVIPCEHRILKDAYFPNSKDMSIDYLQPKYDFVTCKISYTGDDNELGLLSGCAPYFFSKVTGNWKAHADKFGMLTRVLRTDSENRDKLISGYNALKNQVRGNFVVLSKDDELTFEGDARSDISMYQNLNEYCDKSISKILLGQTGTTDEKSFSGSAGVHKEILDSIIRSDREFIESVVNSELVPKLQTLGLLPMNVYLGINENVNVDLTAQVAILKTLSDMGHKVTKDYIEETFDVELEEPIEVVTPNQDTQTQNNE
jgi:hypothetical protein